MKNCRRAAMHGRMQSRCGTRLRHTQHRNCRVHAWRDHTPGVRADEQSPELLPIVRIVLIVYGFVIMILSTAVVPWRIPGIEGVTRQRILFAPLWAMPRVDGGVAVDFGLYGVLFLGSTAIAAACVYAAGGSPCHRPTLPANQPLPRGTAIVLTAPCGVDIRARLFRLLWGVFLGACLGGVIGMLYRLPVVDVMPIACVGAALWGVIWAVSGNGFQAILTTGTLGGIGSGSVNHVLLIGILDRFRVDTAIGGLFLGGVLGGCVGMAGALVVAVAELSRRMKIVSLINNR